jgi:hypothetical protein
MKFRGFLAAALGAGLCVVTAGAAPEYVLKIENPSTVTYNVEVFDQARTHITTISAGRSATWTLSAQTPRVTIAGKGCTASATPSIKTYVTLELKADCKIVTKAAGISGF